MTGQMGCSMGLANQQEPPPQTPSIEGVLNDVSSRLVTAICALELIYNNVVAVQTPTAQPANKVESASLYSRVHLISEAALHLETRLIEVRNALLN